jgi:hypothetical protein
VVSPNPTWVETAVPLNKSGSVVLNANGTGIISFDTDSANQRWEVTNVVISTNQPATDVIIPVVNIALNTSDPSSVASYNLRGATWSGNQDQWSGGTIDVGAIDYLAIVFSPPPGTSGGSLAGVIGYATVTGTKYTRRS